MRLPSPKKCTEPPVDEAVATEHRTMRLCLLISSLGAGGAERVLSVLANAWAGRGHTVTVITLARPDEPPFHNLGPQVTLRCLGLAGRSRSPAQALPSNLRRLRAVRRAVAAARPDLIVSFGDQMNALALLAVAGLGVPVIVSERVHPHLHPIGAPWRLLRRRTYPRAAAVVAQSAAIASAQPQRSRTTVIPNPVVRPTVTGTPVGDRSGDRKRLVALGRLARQKGFDLLLDAFARVASDRMDWRLEIWGEGPERPALCRQAKDLGVAGKVALHGLTHDPAAAFAGADLFALPSRYEGFPNALCEALAAGVPAVAFDCPGAVAEIVRDGVDGILVPAGDTAGFAAALDRLMGDAAERARLAAAAPEVVERYALEDVLARWEALFEQVIRSGKDG